MNVTIPCPCPGTPHDSDTVTVEEPLSFRTRQSLRRSISWAREVTPDFTDGEIFSTLDEGFLVYCITGWTLVGPNEKGKIGPLAPSRENIREIILTNDDLAMPIVKVCNERYQDLVLRPLLVGASTSLPPSPTEPPTSPTNGNGQTPRPKRSKPSSITTIPTVVTGPMPTSPGGESSFSPS